MYSQRAAISFGKKIIRQDQYKLNELKAGIIDRASYTPSVLHISPAELLPAEYIENFVPIISVA